MVARHHANGGATLNLRMLSRDVMSFWSLVEKDFCSSSLSVSLIDSQTQQDH